MAIFPVAYTNLDVYEDSINYIGVAKATLPNIEHKTVPLKGAGMSGEISVPLIGATSNLTLKLDFLSITGDLVTLMEPRKHQIELRTHEQNWNVETAEAGFWADKMVFIGLPKNIVHGDVDPYNTVSASIEFDVYYYAGYRDGKQLWEIDKRNMKHTVNASDYMSQVRKALGK